MLSRIALTQIDPNPDQPRKAFDKAALGELADSIEREGLLQPITVTPRAGRYIIVMGERRWRAHRILAERGGADTILCQVRKMDEDTLDIAAIVENLQRADISPLEEADAFQRLVDRGMEPAEIARRTGAAAFRVNWRLTLGALAPDIRQLLASGNIGLQEANELARLPSHPEQHRMLKLLRTGKLVGWKAVRNAVDAILSAATQEDFFGGGVSEEQVEAVSTMERRIEALAKGLAGGWKDGECVVAAKVDPGRAGRMADQLAAIQKAARIMERELRNAAAQGVLLADDAANAA